MEWYVDINKYAVFNKMAAKIKNMVRRGKDLYDMIYIHLFLE
jgi:hypothetical protein